MTGWSDGLTVQERWNVVAYVQAMRAHESDVLEGEGLFLQRCAACHTGEANSRAPGLDALAVRTPQAIVESLMTGAMRAQGSRMSGVERRAVAVFITGKTIAGDVRGALTGRCTAPAPLRDQAGGPSWSGWSPSAANTRFQISEQSGLAAADLPHRVELEVNDVHTMLDLIGQNLGIAIVPASIAAKRPDVLHATPLHGEQPVWTVAAAVPDQPSPAAAAFLDLLRAG